MSLRSWEFVGVLIVAALALWLLLAGPDDVLGFDSGNVGMVVLVTATWISLYRVSNLPPGELETAISPSQWRAWIGFGVTLAAAAYFLVNLRVFGAGPAWDNLEARAVGRNLVMLLIAWTVLSRVMGARWKGLVQEDERDRGIEIRASGWGRVALVAGIIGIALMLGFSPTEKLRWATHFMIANLLVLALVWSWLCEYAATVAMYWRDRR